MHMPELLDSSLNVVHRINASSMQIALSEEPYHTATMVIGRDEPDINVGAWIRVYTPQGESFVAVVSSVQTAYTTGERTVSLQHAWCLTENSLIIGDVEPGGGSKDSPKSCTPSVAISSALSFAPYWTLGTIDYSNALPYSFDNVSVKAAMDSVLETLDKHQLVFDMTQLPFKVSVKQKPVDVPCEMRMTRNISTMSATVDKSDMWNRFYPIGNGEITLDDLYVEDADSITAWGLVEHTERNTDITDKSMLRAYATSMLSRYSVPLVTVAISGFELSAATSEPMDKLQLGRLCRVPLPTYGTVITQRITKLTWKDAIGQPEAVTVTMCNTRQTVNLLTSKVNSASRSGRSAGRAASSSAAAAATKFESFIGELNSAWTVINQDKEQIQLAAQMLTGNKVLTSSFVVTAGGIASQVTDMANDVSDLHGTVNTQGTRISQTASQVELAAKLLTGSSTISSSVSVSAGGITSKVSKLEGDVQTQGSEISQLSDSIALKADKVTVESLGTRIDNIGTLVNARDSTLTARQVSATSSIDTPYLSATNITFNGRSLSTVTLPVLTSFTQALGGVGSPSSYTLVAIGRTHEYDLTTYF